MVGRAQHECVARAFEKLKPFEGVARFPWIPMKVTENQDGSRLDPITEAIGTIIRPVPEEWVYDERNQWRHGTDPYALPFIRQMGLCPSTEGA
eukprot:540914-Karenia_brevis.AAC.1